MLITFRNVTVRLEAPDAKQAYDDLCELLDRYRTEQSDSGSRYVDWETDTYCVNDGEPHDTSELFPE